MKNELLVDGQAGAMGKKKKNYPIMKKDIV